MTSTAIPKSNTFVYQAKKSASTKSRQESKVELLKCPQLKIRDEKNNQGQLSSIIYLEFRQICIRNSVKTLLFNHPSDADTR